MDFDYWSLPGPRKYVHSLRAEVLQGRNVVLELSRFGPPGLSRAVERAVLANDLVRWRHVDAAVWRDEPWRVLRETLYLSCSDRAEAISALLSREELQGAVIWLDGAGPPCQELWVEFVVDYSEAARNLSTEVPCFVLPVTRRERSQPTGPRISCRTTTEAVGASDTFALVSACLGEARMPRVHRLTQLAMSSELSGSDLVFARRLASVELRKLLQPELLLLERAAEVGWGPNDIDGAGETWHGRRRLHSAAVAVSGDRQEVARRIWRGQVQALFPLIEELRIELLPRTRPFLRLPFTTEFGTISSLEDVEVSHLAGLLERSGAPQPLIRLVRALRRMRHDLAHLRTVRTEDLFDVGFIRACEDVDGNGSQM